MSDEEEDTTAGPTFFEEQVEATARQWLQQIQGHHAQKKLTDAVNSRLKELCAEAGLPETTEADRIEAMAAEELKGLEQAARQVAATERAQVLYREKHGRDPFVAGLQVVGEAKVKAVLDRRLAEREAAKVEAEALAAKEPETVEAPTT